MNVLVVGSGGREHALAWKIAQSPDLDELDCAPGNPGMASLAECVAVPADDVPGLVKLARDKAIDLVVVGPEDPLAMGLVDALKEADILAFGPSGHAAEIEGSKVFCKNLLHKHGIPSAEYRTFTELEPARDYVERIGAPIVVKADGLAKGKGAIVCATQEEALKAVDMMLRDGAFGPAGERIVVEECMVGEEASILAFTDASTIAIMETSQDHKPIFDGDQGPNTGGMGAYSPAPVITPDLAEKIEREIIVPTVHAMNREGRPYSGVLYAGVMVTDVGPKVLEYNARFGDPETQPLLMRMTSDLLAVLLATAEGKLDTATIEWDPRPAVCVVMASAGYPGPYEKGCVIEGLDQVADMPDVQVFHAGTAIKDGQCVTNGGRVLGVTALGEDIKAAQTRAYEAVAKIRFEGAQYRSDIGAKAIGRLGT